MWSPRIDPRFVTRRRSSRSSSSFWYTSVTTLSSIAVCCVAACEYCTQRLVVGEHRVPVVKR